MQVEQSILDRIQRRQLKWYGHSLEWKIVVGQRRFTSGQEKKKTATIMQKPSDRLQEKQRWNKIYLAFGNR